jgi:hypothetical protein
MALFSDRARLTAAMLVIALLSGDRVLADHARKPFRIEVVDAENDWPVPLVELNTVHEVKLYTDNAGVVAIDLPELMGREAWFDVASDGYEVPADGFGRRGVRITPTPGGMHKIKVQRTMIARRLGRITGAGIFGESQKLGEHRDWQESNVLGQDSIQNAVHRGRLFWAWGDTKVARYPLGIYHMTAATTSLTPIIPWNPPLKIALDYFRNGRGELRGIAKMPGDGPTWLSGLVSLPDGNGQHKLVATYVKIRGTLTAYQSGLCVWNDEQEEFEHLKTLWQKSDNSSQPPPMPNGHAVIVETSKGTKQVLFCNPFPRLRCAASYEAWKDPAQWKVLSPQVTIKSAEDNATVKPHAGSIAWNEFRGRWTMVFHEAGGKPSFLGEVWYAEADAPTGPWKSAVKVLSHKSHSFYNVRQHPELTAEDSATLLFEGTYTTFLAANAIPTPRYDYNQIMYSVDLTDPKLAPAQTK